MNMNLLSPCCTQEPFSFQKPAGFGGCLCTTADRRILRPHLLEVSEALSY